MRDSGARAGRKSKSVGTRKICAKARGRGKTWWRSALHARARGRNKQKVKASEAGGGRFDNENCAAEGRSEGKREGNDWVTG